MTGTEVVRVSDTRGTTVARISGTDVTGTTDISLMAARETEMDRRSNIDDFIDSIRESVAFEDDSPGYATQESEVNSLLIEAKIGVTPSAIQRRVDKRPYQIAVENLRNLSRCYSPLEKLRVIGQSNKLIRQCVNSFWEDISYIS